MNKHVYTIKGNETFSFLINISQCNCPNCPNKESKWFNISNIMGRIFPTDKNKRIFYNKDTDTFKVENDEQLQRRLEASSL